MPVYGLLWISCSATYPHLPTFSKPYTMPGSVAFL